MDSCRTVLVPVAFGGPTLCDSISTVIGSIQTSIDRHRSIDRLERNKTKRNQTSRLVVSSVTSTATALEALDAIHPSIHSIIGPLWRVEISHCTGLAGAFLARFIGLN
jgi:hypothetical protein